MVSSNESEKVFSIHEFINYVAQNNFGNLSESIEFAFALHDLEEKHLPFCYPIGQFEQIIAYESPEWFKNRHKLNLLIKFDYVNKQIKVIKK